jgi:hypothetical protein
MVLLATAASARSRYFCKMMGEAVAECCCGAAERASESTGVTARAPDCCERIGAAKGTAVAVDQATTPNVLSAPLVATLPAFEYPAPEFRLTSSAPSFARAPPGAGPPLFIAHCALLI